MTIHMISNSKISDQELLDEILLTRKEITALGKLADGYAFFAEHPRYSDEMKGMYKRLSEMYAVCVTSANALHVVLMECARSRSLVDGE